MDAVKFASMWNMIGMVILGFCANDYQALRNQIRIPFVVYDGYFENEGRICNIQNDDRDGGRQTGMHLRGLGHQRVLCVSDNRECMDLQRYTGLCDGLGFCADFWEIPMRKSEREAFYHDRLRQLRQYSAVFAVSDYYAVELMRFLQNAGVSVPEEISVAGFDDSVICEQDGTVSYFRAAGRRVPGPHGAPVITANAAGAGIFWKFPHLCSAGSQRQHRQVTQLTKWVMRLTLDAPRLSCHNPGKGG